MILITGSTGNLGKSVVNQLLKQIKKEDFIVTTSSKNKLDDLISQGFNARLANFNEPNQLKQAFIGVSKILIISTMDPNRLQQHKNVVDAAVASGVEHILYTGLAIQDIQKSAVKDLMISHFETEDYIKASGLTYTFLRNTMYADALQQILGANATKQDISLPGGQGKVPYILRRELGEAAAQAVLQNNHQNKVYDLVAARAYTYSEVAETLSKISGNVIKYNDIEEATFINQLQSLGFPEFLQYLHAGTIKDIKDQQYEVQSNTIEELLGRPSANLEEMLRELFINN